MFHKLAEAGTMSKGYSRGGLYGWPPLSGTHHFYSLGSCAVTTGQRSNQVFGLSRISTAVN